jgi:NAD(P)H-nitrite reductase large subunit
MTSPSTYIIIGNGIAGITAAETLHREQPHAAITIIADEAVQGYYRPALKDFLAGQVKETQLGARPGSFYQSAHIHIVIARVMHIDSQQHLVYLHDGQTLSYHRLLIASGAHARPLTVPNAQVQGVQTLRTLADYQAIQQRLPAARNIVIYGGGALALETVEILHSRGHAITHLVRNTHLWSEVLDHTASDLLLQRERAQGVTLCLNETIREIQSVNGAITGIVTTTNRTIPCDLLIVAIGIEPNVDFLVRTGIAHGIGIQVNARFQTSLPDVYAAGDVVESPTLYTKISRLVGLWYPAIIQARAAALSMLDRLDHTHSIRFDVGYNSTIFYGLPCTNIGITHLSESNREYQIVVAPPKARSYQKVQLRNGVIQGFLSIGERTHALTFKRAIDAEVNIQPVVHALFQPGFQFDIWLDQQGVPPLTMNVRKTS